MQQLSHPLRFLIFVTLFFALLWVMYATIGFAYFSILQQELIMAAVVSCMVAIVIMIFSTLGFGALSLLLRKFKPYDRIGVFILIPFIGSYAAYYIRHIYLYWTIELGFDPEYLTFKVGSGIAAAIL